MRHQILALTVLLVGAADTPVGQVIQPGEWQTTSRFTSIEMPGAPAAEVDAARAQLGGQGQTENRCITPAEAANPTAAMTADRQRCRYTENSFFGGVIHVRGACQAPSGEMNVSWEGSYTATTMQGNFTTEVTGGPQPMRISGTVESRRVGDCRPGTEISH